MKEKVIFSWSGGKDSALALYELQKTQGYEIVALLTTITQDYDRISRISMHGVRQILLEIQAQSLALAHEKVLISKSITDEQYESKMRDVLAKYLTEGVSSVVFGDISLEGVRKYRENNLLKMGMKAIFPIWKRNTAELAREFIDLGFKTVITSIDSNILDKIFVGKVFDEQFLSKLPSNVDPCGENGEFHSFVYDGPIFHEKIDYSIGEIVLRGNHFYYCDLIPAQI